MLRARILAAGPRQLWVVWHASHTYGAQHGVGAACGAHYLVRGPSNPVLGVSAVRTARV